MEMTYNQRLLKFSIGISLLFWFLVQSVTALAFDKTADFQKKINKQFNISQNGQVELLNKFGNIQINSWDRNEVQIDITITVDAKNKKKADEIFNRIRIEFSNSRDHVSAKTIIDSQKSWWKNVSCGSEEFTINYEVKMPVDCKLDVHNKYGDLIIDRLDNECKVNVKYGNFTIDQINADMDIELGYGHGQLRKTHDVDCNIKYSKLTILEMGDLDIESKYSKSIIEKAEDVEVISRYDGFDFGHIKSLFAQGKYDHYEIDLANKIDFESRYSNLKVDDLVKSANLFMTYGSAKIKNLHSGFNHIKGTGKYITYIINTEEDASYNYDLTTKYGKIKVADQNYNSNDEGSHSHVKGNHGTNHENASIIITSSYGNITIKN